MKTNQVQKRKQLETGGYLFTLGIVMFLALAVLMQHTPQVDISYGILILTGSGMGATCVYAGIVLVARSRKSL